MLPFIGKSVRKSLLSHLLIKIKQTKMIHNSYCIFFKTDSKIMIIWFNLGKKKSDKMAQQL